MLPVIIHPTFNVELPSTKTTISMRPMLVKEEKILLMAREGDEQQDIISAIKQVVNNCVITKDVNVDMWSMFDVEWAFLKLRSQSVSNKTKIAINDKDGESRTFDVNLDEVTMKFPEKIDMDVQVNDTVVIKMQYPPASLYSNKEFLSSTGSVLIDKLIQHSIEKVFDSKSEANTWPDARGRNYEELQKWIDELDVKTYDKIREFLNNLPTLFYEIKYKNKDGKEQVVTLSTLSDFFTL